MKFLVILVPLVFGINAATDRELWVEFKKDHGREYRNLLEEQLRFGIFKHNLLKIEEHNEKYDKGDTSYYLGITQFADKTEDEFLSMLNFSGISKPLMTPEFSSHEVRNLELPSEVDWVSEGVVVGVKDQGNCGSCWAFSTTGALEGAYAIKTGTRLSLSEQNLMDCSTRYGNYGCDGGIMEYAFMYVRDYGIETEEDYPYKGRLGSCRYSSSLNTLELRKYMTANGEANLKSAVATVGPVAVGVNANYFQLYSGGIFDERNCDSNLNHGVLVVGYGTQGSKPYWLVKNSWGKSWGERGYIKMVRDKDNQCGIASEASYPVLN